MHPQGIRTRAALAVTAMVAAGALAPSAHAAGATCSQVRYSDRLQAQDNAAGVIFVRKGDYWKVWDNQRDGWRVTVQYNYAGVRDAWKTAAHPQDGAAARFQPSRRTRSKA